MGGFSRVPRAPSHGLWLIVISNHSRANEKIIELDYYSKIRPTDVTVPATPRILPPTLQYPSLRPPHCTPQHPTPSQLPPKEPLGAVGGSVEELWPFLEDLHLEGLLFCLRQSSSAVFRSKRPSTPRGAGPP